LSEIAHAPKAHSWVTRAGCLAIRLWGYGLDVVVVAREIFRLCGFTVST
jgi:hypothetical protein